MSGTHERRHWPLWAMAAVVVVAVAGYLVIRTVVLKDRATPVTKSQAVDRFRGSSSVPAAPSTTGPSTESRVSSTTTGSRTTSEPTALVAIGVYRYETVGSEHVDILGGATHTYPSETTITVTPEGCGVRLRWDALQERRDEWQVCETPSGLTSESGLQYHEFFRQPDLEPIVCPSGTLLVPRAAAPGTSWDAECTLDGAHWVQHLTVVGEEAISVGGRDVMATHLRQVISMDSTYPEHTTVDWWLTEKGLPVQASGTKESKSASPIGTVTYREQYSLHLESLQPLR